MVRDVTTARGSPALCAKLSRSATDRPVAKILSGLGGVALIIGIGIALAQLRSLRT